MTKLIAKEITENFIENARHEAFSPALLDKYPIQQVTEAEFWPTNWLDDFAFLPNDLYFERDKLSPAEQLEKLEQLDNLTSSTIKLEDNLLIKTSDTNQTVALLKSYQKAYDSYYMHVAAVHKNYRRLGIYSALLDRIISYTHSLGFNKILSCHSPANNPVLIAHLKKNFKILSMEIDAELGVNIWLCYFHNKEMEKAHELRSGNISFSRKMYQSSHGTATQLFEALKAAKPDEQ